MLCRPAAGARMRHLLFAVQLALLVPSVPRATDPPPPRAEEQPPSRAQEQSPPPAQEQPPSPAQEQPPSRAEEQPPSPETTPGIARRFAIAVRAGYHMPVGAAYADPSTGEDLPLSGAFASQVPIQLEVSYALSGRFSVGAYASWGFDSVGRTVKTACDSVPASCSASTLRAGVEGFWSPGELRPGLSTWLGLGIGWEWSQFARSSALTETFSGPEIASLQAGVDKRFGRRYSLGPYVQLAAGRFLSLEQRAPMPFGSSNVDIAARFHAWFGFGLRGTIHL